MADNGAMSTSGLPGEALASQWLRIGLRHKKKAVAVLMLAPVLALVATAVAPRKYQSEGKLSVRLGRENLSPDPTVMASPEAIVSASGGTRDTEINSVAEVLHSRVVLEKVIDELGVEVLLEAAPATATPQRSTQEASIAGSSAAEGDWLSLVMPSRAAGPRERALRQLERGLNVTPVRKTSIVTVTYDAGTPQLAQAVVARLMDAYIVEHLRINRSRGAHGFLAEETARLRDELARGEQKLRDLKNETGLTSTDGQRQSLISRLARLEDDVLRNLSATAATQAKIKHLSETLAKLPETEVKENRSGVGDQGTDTMRAQLFVLQNREQQLAAKYTDSHPLLTEVRRQVQEARDALAQEQKSRTEVTTARNHSFVQAESALLTERATLAGLDTEGKAYQQQLADVRSSLSTLNENERRIAELQRENQLCEANYRRYAANLEQARLDQAMQEQGISNISIVQPASLQLRATSPRPASNLLFGMVAGLAGAVGSVVLAERLDRTARSPSQIQRATGLPVLGGTPRVRSAAMVRNGV